MSETKEKRIVKIVQDEYPVDPRKDFDTYSTIICGHKSSKSIIQ